MISTFGALAGIATGVILSLLQEHFGILSMGGGGSFVVDSYPVAIETYDILIVFATVLIVGLTAVWLPTKYLTKRLLKD
jgi:lipoprotein-releasing system permease protein